MTDTQPDLPARLSDPVGPNVLKRIFRDTMSADDVATEFWAAHDINPEHEDAGERIGTTFGQWRNIR